jgi:hypothetical protein
VVLNSGGNTSAQPPIDVSGNFLAHLSAESPSNISPNPSEVISQSFGTIGKLLKFSKKKLKMPPPGGQEGVSEYFGGLISPFFVRINPREVLEL